MRGEKLFRETDRVFTDMFFFVAFKDISILF